MPRRERRGRRATVVTADGRDVAAFDLSGPAEAGPPGIALLPGAGDTAASWALVEGRLNRSHRVLTYARVLPHGGVPQDRQLGAIVRQLDDVLTASGLRGPVVLVGHSFGGLVARAYAAAHPDRVAGLVLVDATPPAVADDPAVRIGFAVSARLARALQALAPLGVIRVLLALKAMPLYPTQRRFQRAVSAEAYRRWVVAVNAGFADGAPEELSAVLPGVRSFLESAPTPLHVPVGLVHSRAYGPKWERMQRDVAAELCAVSLLPTGESDHNIHMSRPDLIERAVVDVLQRLDEGGPDERPAAGAAAAQ